MLKNKIKDFVEKYPHFDMNKFLVHFENGYTTAQLVEEHNVTELPLRKFAYSLGLEFSRLKRKCSVDEFKYRLSLEEGSDFKIITELELENSKLADKNRKLYQSLTLARDEATNLRRWAREEVRKEHLVDHLLSTFEKHLSSMDIQPVQIDKYDKENYKLPLQGLCVILSDEHIGNVVEEEKVPWNNYSYDIARKRLERVLTRVINYPKQSQELTIFNLLDTIQGMIHGAVPYSEDGLIGQIIAAVDIYVGLYEGIASQYSKINIVTVNDNHSRLSEKPSTQNKWDNLSIMLFKMVERILQAKGLNHFEFSFTKHDYQLVNINGANIFALHGDTIRSYRPESASEVAKAQDVCMGIFKEPFRHIISGHRHHHLVCDNQYGGVSIQNASLNGNTEYGMTSGYRPIQPSQTFFFVEEDGRIDSIEKVSVGDIVG